MLKRKVAAKRDVSRKDTEAKTDVVWTYYDNECHQIVIKSHALLCGRYMKQRKATKEINVKTSKFITQCKGDISDASKTAKITMLTP